MQDPASQSPSYEQITKELYSKNVDLVSANKTLELIQDLYEIMISCYSPESVSQHFIETICTTLGFVDGVVAIPFNDKQSLKIAGITQTQNNNAILEMTRVPIVDIGFGLSSNNALVRVFSSGHEEKVDSIIEIWSPYIKESDIPGIKSRTVLVYPIIFGDKIFGSFGLVAGEEVEKLTKFESKTLARLVTVFGIALDRVRINTELAETEARELEKAKELLHLKDEFVFIATHDLKMPVTAISGYIELINKSSENFSNDTKENLVAINEASSRLKQLTNDLLEVARSESGVIKVTTSPVSIAEIIQNTYRQLKPSADQKRVSVTINMDSEAVSVLADKPKLSEVIENLFSNAIKYNRNGGSLYISSRKQEKNLEISFADTGLGIPQSDQPQVFQKFFRARQKGTEGIPGTGLGLFVVRMLVEKMNGTISFQSEEGKGTTFTFSLPIAG